jgi:hypothetical protein
MRATTEDFVKVNFFYRSAECIVLVAECLSGVQGSDTE